MEGTLELCLESFKRFFEKENVNTRIGDDRVPVAVSAISYYNVLHYTTMEPVTTISNGTRT